MTGPALALIGFVCCQRVVELAIARRNTARLLACGGREVGARHYPVIVALHVAWLAALAGFGRDAAVVPGWIVLYGVLQVLRVWILVSLKGRWTTRIILVDEPAIRTGPYRFLAHPNYWLVAAEIVCVPMALGLPWAAVVFTIFNAAAMRVRIRAENAALATLPAGPTG